MKRYCLSRILEPGAIHSEDETWIAEIDRLAPEKHEAVIEVRGFDPSTTEHLAYLIVDYLNSNQAQFLMKLKTGNEI